MNDNEATSTKVLDTSVYVKVFEKVVSKIETERCQEIGSMVFDKDDQDALEFVIAASNIRAHNFGI